MAGTKKSQKYPWAALYDLESKRRTRGPGQRGRPASTVAKKNKTFSIPIDELGLLTDSEYRLQKALHPHSVSKSQVIGLAIRLLNNQLHDTLGQGISVDSWEKLADMVFSEQKE
jgi:hypothetical protein